MIITSITPVAWDTQGQIITDYLGRVFVRPDGRELSQTEYTELYGYLGDRFNLGSTTAGFFRIPDLTDAFLRGTSFNTTGDPDAASRTLPGTATTDADAGTVQVKSLTGHSHAVGSIGFINFWPPAGGPPGFIPPNSPDITYNNTSGSGLFGSAAASGYGIMEVDADMRPLTVVVDYLMRIK